MSLARADAVIFDMDGVLTDSEPLINAAAVAMFREKGLVVQPDDFIPFVGTGEDRYISGVAEKYQFPIDIPLAKKRTYEIYLQLVPTQLRAFPGAKELVQRCRDAGLRIAVASSADWLKIEANLRQIGLPPEMWDAVVCGDELARKKPDPEIFLTAAQKLGVEPARCVVIEDAINGIAAAKAAGMRCVAVAQTFPPEKLQNADLIRRTLTEITLDDFCPASRVKAWHWGIHLALLALYPIVLGVILPQLFQTGERGTLLPDSTLGLLNIALGEMLIFGAVFATAWLSSRATGDDLLLRWNQGFAPLWRGIIYSIALRIAIAAVVIVVGIIAALAGSGATELLERIRPRTEIIVSPNALQQSPVYLLLTLTLISFVVAGLREELWRAGVLAGLREIWPARFGSRSGQMVAVALAALAFGLGHLPQGWGGTAVTAILGFGLGLIMIYHRSIWEAVFAHGFFNATTFLMLYCLARWYPGLVPGQ